MIKLRATATFFILFCISGCATRLYTDAVLLSAAKPPPTVAKSQDTPTGPTPSPAVKDIKQPENAYFQMESDGADPYSNNQIVISSDSKFSLAIDRIRMGWIDADGDTDLLESIQHSFSDGYDPKIIHHFRGKQLWFLSTVTSLNPADPLESNTKRYFKSSSIKFQSGSFQLVPLDSAERVIFTHTSDASYRVRLQIYEVSNVQIKRELKKLSDIPGLVGIGEAALTTLFSSVGNLGLGSSLMQRLKAGHQDEPLGFERFLLAAGGKERFRGEVLLIRDTRTFNERNTSPESPPATKITSDPFILVDLYPTPNSDKPLLTNQETFQAALNRETQKRFEWADSSSLAETGSQTGQTPSQANAFANSTYLRLVLTEAVNPSILADEKELTRTLPYIEKELAEEKEELEKLPIDQLRSCRAKKGGTEYEAKCARLSQLIESTNEASRAVEAIARTKRTLDSNVTEAKDDFTVADAELRKLQERKALSEASSAVDPAVASELDAQIEQTLSERNAAQTALDTAQVAAASAPLEMEAQRKLRSAQAARDQFGTQLGLELDAEVKARRSLVATRLQDLVRLRAHLKLPED